MYWFFLAGNKKIIAAIVVIVIIVLIISFLCCPICKDNCVGDDSHLDVFKFIKETPGIVPQAIFVPYVVRPYPSHVDRILDNFDPPPSYEQTIYQPTKLHQMEKNKTNGIETWKKDTKLVN